MQLRQPDLCSPMVFVHSFQEIKERVHVGQLPTAIAPGLVHLLCLITKGIQPLLCAKSGKILFAMKQLSQVPSQNVEERYSLNVAIFHCPLVLKQTYYGKTLVLNTEKSNGVPFNALTDLKAWFCTSSTFLHSTHSVHIQSLQWCVVNEVLKSKKALKFDSSFRVQIAVVNLQHTDILHSELGIC